MNYKKIYDSLIDKRKNKEPLEKQKDTHVHHIVPKCCGGGDEPENLVRLTLREHYIAHLLLPKIYKYGEYHFKLICALQRMGNSKEHNFYRYNSRLYEIYVKERNRIVGERSKEILKGRTIFKNVVTGERRCLFIDSDEVKSGEWVGIRNGTKDPATSKRLKNMVSAIDKDGKIVQISKEEFDSNRDRYTGVNAGRKGMFDKLNEALRNRKWFEKMMYTDTKCTRPKKTCLGIFNLELLQELYAYTKLYPGKKRMDWNKIEELCTKYKINNGKPLGKLIYMMRRENWNPIEDIEFVDGCHRYNKLLTEYYKNENN